MHAVLFSLVVSDNPNLVFAWGMEIIYSEDPESTEPTQKAILYVGHPNSQGTVSTHTSAEAACTRWSQIVPLKIEWDADMWADAYKAIRN